MSNESTTAATKQSALAFKILDSLNGMGAIRVVGDNEQGDRALRAMMASIDSHLEPFVTELRACHDHLADWRSDAESRQRRIDASAKLLKQIRGAE